LCWHTYVAPQHKVKKGRKRGGGTGGGMQPGETTQSTTSSTRLFSRAGIGALRIYTHTHTPALPLACLYVVRKTSREINRKFFLLPFAPIRHKTQTGTQRSRDSNSRQQQQHTHTYIYILAVYTRVDDHHRRRIFFFLQFLALHGQPFSIDKIFVYAPTFFFNLFLLLPPN